MPELQILWCAVTEKDFSQWHSQGQNWLQRKELTGYLCGALQDLNYGVPDYAKLGMRVVLKSIVQEDLGR